MTKIASMTPPIPRGKIIGNAHCQPHHSSGKKSSAVARHDQQRSAALP